MSLKSQLLQYLNNRQDWINSGEIEDHARELGYKASNGTRRMRELVSENKALRRLNGSGVVEYRFKDQTPLRSDPSAKYPNVKDRFGKRLSYLEKEQIKKQKIKKVKETIELNPML